MRQVTRILWASLCLPPTTSRTITVAEGQVLLAPITATNDLGKPPQNGVPIPNVGIRLADPGSGSLAPSPFAACQGSSRGDDRGVSRCNVVGICQPAGTSFPLSANALASVGEAAFFPVVINLTQGTRIQDRDKRVLTRRRAVPGNPFVLIGQITDGCGQPAGNVSVTWSVTLGQGRFPGFPRFPRQTGTFPPQLSWGIHLVPCRFKSLPEPLRQPFST